MLRLVVIGLGTELVDNFQIVNLGFAAFLIFNAWQMVTAGEGKEEDLADKWIVKACRCTPALASVSHAGSSSFNVWAEGLNLLMLILYCAYAKRSEEKRPCGFITPSCAGVC